MLIRQKIYAGGIIAIVGIIVTIAIWFSALERIDREMKQDALSIEVRRGVYQLSLLTRDYMRYGSARAGLQWRAKHRELNLALAALDKLATAPHAREHLSRLKDGSRVIENIFSRVVRGNEALDIPASNGSDLANYRALLEASFALRSEIMIADANELSSLSKREARQVRRLSLAMATASVVALFMIIATMALALTRRVLSTASDLRRGAEVVGAGDFSYAIPLSGNDEMSAAIVAFNTMADRLHRSQGSLEAANAGLQKEIAIRSAAESRLQASEEKFRSLAHSANDAIVSCDSAGRIIYCNAAAVRIFGYQDSITGMPLEMLMPERFRAAHARGMEAYLQSGVSRVSGQTVELVGMRQDGSEFPLDLSLAAWVTNEGQFFTGVIRDITDRKQSEARLFQEKELAQITLASIADGVITTDDNGKVQFMNPVAAALTGWDDKEACGRPFGEVFRSLHEVSRVMLPDPVTAALATKQPWSAQDAVLVARDGTEYLIEASAAPILTREGDIAGVVVVCHNVTEARTLNARLLHDASHDTLTGLYNRAYFEEVLTTALARARSGSGDSTLLYLDLDQFKVINDSCSHRAGDELLRQIAKLIVSLARKSDTVARLGGDEFGVLLADCSVEDAQRMAFGFVEALHQFRFTWHDKLFSVSASIGVVGIDAVSIDRATVLSAADTACFIAKDRGRNQIAVFEPENAEVIRRHGEMNWVSRITQGLQEHRFVLFHQKIAHVATPQQQGEHYELLLRLREEDGRLVPPMAFIPAAERYNLMPAIDRWVIATFFEYAARRPNPLRGDTFAINLSGTSINDPSFLAFITAQFERTGAVPQSICFEITETAAIANLTRATAVMTALKEMGCRFSLDDFGSGLSSFGYLKNLPVDYLKIDGSFVKGILTDRVDRAMVDAINRVGHIIGIQTIAEFVDNDKVLEELRAIGVDFAQGYGIHQPQQLELAASTSTIAA